MNGMKLRFKLVTPDRVLVDEEVMSISLPTESGEITILPGHAALSSLLFPGIARISRKNGTEEVAVSGGFIQVAKDGTVSVLADTAEQGHELNVSVIEEAKKRAQEVMKKAAAQDDVSFAAAAAALERELARYRLVSKHHGKTRNIHTAD